MTKVVLLDRDGTIIVDPPDERVTNEDQIQLFPDSLSALKKLAENGFVAIIITNQAGIGEGKITIDEFEEIHVQVLERLKPSGLQILKTYMCPHTATDGCECRKPKPTLILRAAEDFNLKDTFMIGDHRSDVLAGKNAGTQAVLVKTATNGQDDAPEADFVANNLSEAIDYVIANS